MGRKFTLGTSNGDSLPDLSGQTVDWTTTECDVCGDEFTTLAVLTDLPGRTRCHDCREPLSRGGSTPWQNDRPLMEYGPLSHGG